jgi:biotin carboxyl carrier protein
MFEVSLQGKKYLIEKQGNTLLLDGQSIQPDAIRLDANRLHLLVNGKGYQVEVLEQAGQNLRLRVNQHVFEVKLRTELDLMLNKLGIDSGAEQKINELKAPMPGLVLRLVAEPGQEVKKGDPLLVLESMKMENVLKSPGQGIVDKLVVEVGNTVEKGQVLLLFR